MIIQPQVVSDLIKGKDSNDYLYLWTDILEVHENSTFELLKVKDL